jgi:hypothetical protein
LKKATKKGGDKYVSIQDNSFVIYLPQYLSRQENGEVKKEMELGFVF